MHLILQSLPDFAVTGQTSPFGRRLSLDLNETDFSPNIDDAFAWLSSTFPLDHKTEYTDTCLYCFSLKSGTLMISGYKHKGLNSWSYRFSLTTPPKTAHDRLAYHDFVQSLPPFPPNSSTMALAS
jgi:hypothetical protein